MVASRTQGGVILSGDVDAAARLVGFPIPSLAATPGSLGQFLEKKLLDMIFGAVAFGTIPATLYLGLLSDTNTDAQRAAGTYTELAASNGYARTAITNNLTNWPAATGGSPGSKSNGVAITPPTPTGALWTTINGVIITDSVTNSAGNIYAVGSLVNTIGAGATSINFPIGALTLTLL